MTIKAMPSPGGRWTPRDHRRPLGVVAVLVLATFAGAVIAGPERPAPIDAFADNSVTPPIHPTPDPAPAARPAQAPASPLPATQPSKARSPRNNFPPGYDPARLGEELVVGDSWQGLDPGSDAGYTAILGLHMFRQGMSPYPPPAPGQVRLERDPIFGQVLTVVQPDYHARKFSATVEGIRTFPPITHFWYRAVARFDGNGNPAGFTPRGTGLRVGSTTYKLLFAFPTNGQNRMELELTADGGLFPMFGQPGSNIAVGERLGMGGAPVPPGLNPGNSKLYITGRGADGAGMTGNLLQSREWFEMVLNFEAMPGGYLQRYFVRQLTMDGGATWAPVQFPRWGGTRFRITAGEVAGYRKIHLGGNKSQTNDGPNDQLVRWGPWEVTTARDPYGWDRYGK